MLMCHTCLNLNWSEDVDATFLKLIIKICIFSQVIVFGLIDQHKRPLILFFPTHVYRMFDKYNSFVFCFCFCVFVCLFVCFVVVVVFCCCFLFLLLLFCFLFCFVFCVYMCIKFNNTKRKKVLILCIILFVGTCKQVILQLGKDEMLTYVKIRACRPDTSFHVW